MTKMISGFEYRLRTMVAASMGFDTQNEATRFVGDDQAGFCLDRPEHIPAGSMKPANPSGSMPVYIIQP